jgi:hypothetical protein
MRERPRSIAHGSRHHLLTPRHAAIEPLHEFVEQHQAREVHRDALDAMRVGRAESRQRGRMRAQPHRDRDAHGVHEHRRRIAGQQTDAQHARRRHGGARVMNESDGQHSERGNHKVDARARFLDQEQGASAIVQNDYRAANIRAGYVYVISNRGALGEHVVKIGLTRRLEPRDRIDELGDASVPFRFDVHALYFSEDAVKLENDLHDHFASRRMNWANNRKEFFFASPVEVRSVLIEKIGNLLEFDEHCESTEYNQSVHYWPEEFRGPKPTSTT